MTTAEEIGRLIRTTRTGLGLTQENLALTSGTGVRFIVDLEKGKPTCQLGKALTVMSSLGIDLSVNPPHTEASPSANDGHETP